MQVKVRFYFDSQYMELDNVNEVELMDWLQDVSRPVHEFIDKHGDRYIVFKDKILYMKIVS